MMSTIFNLSKELTLLLRLSNKRDINNLDKSIFDSIDLNSIKNLIAYHKIGIQLYDNISISTKKLFPDEFHNFLKSIKDRQIRHSLKIVKVLSDVRIHFTEHDIPFIVLKGPVSAIQTYGTIHSRQYNDVDILVPADNMYKASNLIEMIFPSNINVLKIFSIDHQNHIMEKCLHNSYYCKECAVPIELHQKLFLNYFNRKDFDRHANDFGLVKIQDAYYTSLPENLFLLFQFYHGSKHCWTRLKYLLEIHDYLVSMDFSKIEWNNIWDLARYYSIDNCLIQGLKLLNLVYSYEVPCSLSNKPINSFLVNFPIRQLNSGCANSLSGISNKWYKWLLVKKKSMHMHSTGGLSLNDMLLFPLPKNLFFIYNWAKPFFYLYRFIVKRYPFSDYRKEVYAKFIAND